jgi:amidohydrolase
VHTTTLLGVAGVLRRMAPQLAGTIKLVFQPAEETLGGMAAMIEDGVMEGPHVDIALGFHNRPTMPVGQFGYIRGIGSASSDHIKIVVSGRSGHAAHPNNAVDPVVAAAHLVTQLQTVVSREVDPLHPAVVTIGAINGGYAHNIIPDSVTLLGTVRTLDEKARAIAEAAIQRLCDGMLGGMRVRCELTYTRGVPSIRNDDRVLDVSVAAVRQQFGPDKIHEGRAGLGGEDFALMTDLVPGCRLLIGSGQKGRSDHLHNSDYQPDEACIGLGVEALSRAALELLG